MYVHVIMFYHKTQIKFDIVSKHCNEVTNCVLLLHGCMTQITNLVILKIKRQKASLGALSFLGINTGTIDHGSIL